VQIIEVTGFAVRSAALRLQHRQSALQFVVYPMIHMAEPGFYAAVTSRLRSADVVVIEGIGGGQKKRSLLTSALTLSYTVLRFNRGAKLVKQDIDYVALGVEVISPDVSFEEFETGWRKVPLAHRLMLWCLLPIVVLARLFGGTRMIWSRTMELNDLPSPDEEEHLDRMPELDAALAGDRDKRLLAALHQLHEQRSGEAIEVAVVYGAGHVPAIVQDLTDRFGYKVRSADWLTVVDLL